MEMRLKDVGQAMVLSPGPCLGIRYEEQNSNRQSTTTNDVISRGGSLNNNSTQQISVNNNRERQCSESSHDSQGQSSTSSSIDVFPQGDEYQCFSQEDLTDSEFSDDGNCAKEDELPTCGISNPNYFERISPSVDPNGNENGKNCVDEYFASFISADKIAESFFDEQEKNQLSQNDYRICKHELFSRDVSLDIERLNLDSGHHFEKDFYDKPKFEHDHQIIQGLNIIGSELNDGGHENIFPEINFVISSTDHKFEFSPKESYQDSGVCSTVSTESECFESFLVETTLFPVSGVFETTILPDDDSSPEEEHPNFQYKEIDSLALNELESMEVDKSKQAKDSANERKMVESEVEKKKRDIGWKGECSPGKGPGFTRLAPRKGEQPLADALPRRGGNPKIRNYASSRRSATEKKTVSDIGVFDVYNIETAMPKFDFDAIAIYLKAATEEEQRRRNDREEIRRRLAMGPDNDDLYCSDRPERTGRKPSLQSRLQSGMNLQICFMNDTGSDSESPSTDESTPPPADVQRPTSLPVKNGQMDHVGSQRPSAARLTLPLKNNLNLRSASDFYTCQARLQYEARQALMQAKDMARMQMEVEKQKMPLSPITQMVRASLLKVGVPFPEERRRLSRQILTEMNVAQLQVIINDLHSQIEVLNENLVEYLMTRDDLHMEQDSMLVDIEDITRYIGAKEKALESNNVPVTGMNEIVRQNQTSLHNFA